MKLAAFALGVVFSSTAFAGDTLVACGDEAHAPFTYLPISKKSRFADKIPLIEASLKKLSADGTIGRLIRKDMAAVGVELPK